LKDANSKNRERANEKRNNLDGSVIRLDRYLIRLDNPNSKYAPTETMEVLKELRIAADPFGCVVKNLRLSSRALEFDLYSKDEDAKNRCVRALASGFGKEVSERNLSVDEKPLDKIATLNASIKLFDEQRYWECHETMEQAWRKQPKGPEKDVQQGLILAASALVHFQKGENEVCLNMIPRTLARLSSWTADHYFSLNVKKLKRNLEKIYESREIKPFLL
jgi:uncharacterized protein